MVARRRPHRLHVHPPQREGQRHLRAGPVCSGQREAGAPSQRRRMVGARLDARREAARDRRNHQRQRKPAAHFGHGDGKARTPHSGGRQGRVERRGVLAGWTLPFRDDGSAERISPPRAHRSAIGRNRANHPRRSALRCGKLCAQPRRKAARLRAECGRRQPAPPARNRDESNHHPETPDRGDRASPMASGRRYARLFAQRSRHSHGCLFGGPGWRFQGLDRERNRRARSEIHAACGARPHRIIRRHENERLPLPPRPREVPRQTPLPHQYPRRTRRAVARGLHRALELPHPRTRRGDLFPERPGQRGLREIVPRRR